MKNLLKFVFFLTLPLSAMAKPIVLISYYDTFGKNKFNNSEKVALSMAASLKLDARFEIKLCILPTAFDRGYAALENCQKSLPEAPILYLGLGEYGCAMKIETMGRNMDKNPALPDNDGNKRNQVIIPEGAKVIGFNFPAPDMYCSLPPKARGDIDVSNNAGSFVCNHTAYQFAHYYPEIPSGFIHVPANTCRNLETRTKEASERLAEMVKSAVTSLSSSNGVTTRLPLSKKELESLRSNKSDGCRSEFFKRMKNADDVGFWSQIF